MSLSIRRLLLPVIIVSGILAACTGPDAPAPTPNQNPPAIAPPAHQPPPQRVPSPATPTPPNGHSPVDLRSSPSYCKALVSTAQANELGRFVVETYNKRMKHIPNFKRAQVSANGEQPTVTFANYAAPNLYFPKNATQMHSTLCSSPESPFFQCADNRLHSSIAAVATTPNPVSAYVSYYENEVSLRRYTYEVPREFGPIFVALPLRPVELHNSKGQVISGVLHISVVKVFSSNQTNPETPTSARHKAEFIRALKEEFVKQKALLPNTLTLGAVQCSP